MESQLEQIKQKYLDNQINHLELHLALEETLIGENGFLARDAADCADFKEYWNKVMLAYGSSGDEYWLERKALTELNFVHRPISEAKDFDMLEIRTMHHGVGIAVYTMIDDKWYTSCDKDSKRFLGGENSTQTDATFDRHLIKDRVLRFKALDN